MRASAKGEAGGSPLVIFGAELRHWRQAAGLSQEQLGDLLGYSGDQVGAVETGRRMPSPDLVERADKILDTGGALARLLDRLKDFLKNQAYPAWFRGWPNVEAEAATLRWWEPMVIPGLLQTEAYAGALLSVHPGVTPEQVTERVASRLRRQEVITGDSPPFMWFLVDESALRRRIGSAEVMREQLGHLIEMAAHPQITVQVIPYEVGAHPGLLGAFVIAGFDDQPSIVNLETPAMGQIAEAPNVVGEVTLAWEALRSVALPVAASLELIARITEEQWT